MSKIKKVDSYQTTDGKTYPSLAEAEAEQAKIDFREWYVDNDLIAVYGNKVQPECLCEWLREHRWTLKAFMDKM